MDMTLGIESAARVVLEEGIDEISGLDRNLAALHIAPSFRETLLDPRHGLGDRGHVGGEDALVPCDIGHHRRGLWHRAGKVESCASVLDQIGRASCRERVCQYV